jgi:hypothetical protein
VEIYERQRRVAILNMEEQAKDYLKENAKVRDGALAELPPPPCYYNLPNWAKGLDSSAAQYTSAPQFQTWLQEVYKQNQKNILCKIRDMTFRPICRKLGRFLDWFWRTFRHPASQIRKLSKLALDYGYGKFYVTFEGELCGSYVSYLEGVKGGK